MIKKVKLVELGASIVTVFCNKNYQHKFDEMLKGRFFHTWKFPNHGNNKFTLLLRKVFILINVWMIWKNSTKYHYLKKWILTVN